MGYISVSSDMSCWRNSLFPLFTEHNPKEKQAEHPEAKALNFSLRTESGSKTECVVIFFYLIAHAVFFSQSENSYFFTVSRATRDVT